jgi:hypothetical protein
MKKDVPPLRWEPARLPLKRTRARTTSQRSLRSLSARRPSLTPPLPAEPADEQPPPLDGAPPDPTSSSANFCAHPHWPRRAGEHLGRSARSQRLRACLMGRHSHAVGPVALSGRILAPLQSSHVRPGLPDMRSRGPSPPPPADASSARRNTRYSPTHPPSSTPARSDSVAHAGASNRIRPSQRR